MSGTENGIAKEGENTVTDVDGLAQKQYRRLLIRCPMYALICINCAFSHSFLIAAFNAIKNSRFKALIIGHKFEKNLLI